MFKALPILLALTMSIVATGGSSAAAVTCTFTSGVLTVDLSDPDPLVAFVVNAGTIEVHTQAGPIPCGDPATPPTVSNTDLIRATVSSQAATLFVDQTGGLFAPGLTAEPDGSSEIEFEIDMSGSPDPDPVEDAEFVFVYGTAAPELLTTSLGSGALPQGINLNATEATQDTDVMLSGAEVLVIRAGGGNDRAVGSAAFFLESFLGGPGNDRLSGGAGFDELIGQSGNDRLSGGPAFDMLNGGSGKDRCAGGPGQNEIKKCE